MTTFKDYLEENTLIESNEFEKIEKEPNVRIVRTSANKPNTDEQFFDLSKLSMNDKVAAVKLIKKLLSSKPEAQGKSFAQSAKEKKENQAVVQKIANMGARVSRRGNEVKTYAIRLEN